MRRREKKKKLILPRRRRARGKTEGLLGGSMRMGRKGGNLHSFPEETLREGGTGRSYPSGRPNSEKHSTSMTNLKELHNS